MRSPDIDFADALKPVLRYGRAITKNVLSALKVPRLKNLLKKEGVSHVYLCGIDTDCCVLATAYDAFDQGYRVAVLKNLSMSHAGNALHQAALRMVARNVGGVE